MTKQQTILKIEQRISYLLAHCDSEAETETVEWVAGHLASEFGVDKLNVGWDTKTTILAA
jgi:hypothetical protein